MRALGSIVLALASIAAGCILPPDPGADLGADAAAAPARLACYTLADAPVCNFEATTTHEQGNEVTIAVNPTDPMNIVAGAKDYTAKYTGGQCVWDGVYVTKDGGKTWKNHPFPGSPWVILEDPGAYQPSIAGTHWCATDPVVAFGPDGTFYYAAMAYQGDPVTASKLGKDQTCALSGAGVPIGCTGVNDFAFNRATQLVAVSTDGGESFDYVSMVDTGSFPVNFHDRQWIDVGEDGTVYVAWTSVAIPGNVLFRSVDRARTWEGPVVLNEYPTILGPGGMFVAAGVGETVYVSGWGDRFDERLPGLDPGVYVTTSTDGGKTFGGWKRVAGEADDGMEATYRSGGVGMVAADRAKPNVYVAWADTRNGDRDVFVASSADGGETWADAIRVNDDAIGNGKDQFMPAISVSPSGVVDVVWYDRRNDPENTLLDVYHATSRDGGKTWSTNLRITPAPMDPEHSKHQGGFTFIGDYIDIASTDLAAHPVWVDTRNEVADVFTAAILRAPDATFGFEGPALGEDEAEG